MKAIYTKLGNKVYKVNQNTASPTAVTSRASGVSSSLNIDNFNKGVTQNLYINTLQKPGTESNAEVYTKLVDFLRNNLVTEITMIQNRFKIYVDYSAYEGNKEVEHSSVIRPITPLDKAVILGVATNNECVYRRVKTFNDSIEFRMMDALPHGIMNNVQKDYKLKINNIAIFQDFSEQEEVHTSTYETAYGIGSTTIQAGLDNMNIVYSTFNEGVDIQPIETSFMPRTITLAFDIILSNYAVVYDQATIDAVLIENIESKYPVIVPDEPIVPVNYEVPMFMMAQKEVNIDADGEYDPDDNGYFSYYERCLNTTPHALSVVEDLTPDGYYDTSKMIKRYKVLPDIGDIKVGDYVIFRESLNSMA